MGTIEMLLRTACKRLAMLAAVKLALVVLNYLVPCCVSSYSAARNEMRREEESA